MTKSLLGVQECGQVPYVLHSILQQPWNRDTIDSFTFLGDGGGVHHVDQAGPDLLDSGKLEPLQ